MNFSAPFWSHATVGSVDLAPSPALERASLVEQSSAANWAWSLAAAAASPEEDDGFGVGLLGLLAPGVGEAFSASESARPLVELEALGWPDGVPLPEALGVPEGVGLP